MDFSPLVSGLSGFVKKSGFDDLNMAPLVKIYQHSEDSAIRKDSHKR